MDPLLKALSILPGLAASPGEWAKALRYMAGYKAAYFLVFICETCARLGCQNGFQVVFNARPNNSYGVQGCNAPGMICVAQEGTARTLPPPLFCLGYLQYVSVVRRSMVSCFNLEFFLPIVRPWRIRQIPLFLLLSLLLFPSLSAVSGTVNNR